MTSVQNLESLTKHASCRDKEFKACRGKLPESHKIPKSNPILPKSITPKEIAISKQQYQSYTPKPSQQTDKITPQSPKSQNQNQIS